MAKKEKFNLIGEIATTQRTFVVRLGLRPSTKEECQDLCNHLENVTGNVAYIVGWNSNGDEIMFPSQVWCNSVILFRIEPADEGE